MVKEKKAQHFLRAASLDLGTSEDLLRGSRKNREITKARHIIMYCLWKQGYTHSFIGRLLNKNHATSILACRNVEYKPNWIEIAKRLMNIKFSDDGQEAPTPKKYQGKWTSLFKVYEAKCQVCGVEDILEVHHRIPVKNGGSNDANNLIILCPNHHAMLHCGLLLIRTIAPPKMLSSYQSNRL